MRSSRVETDCGARRCLALAEARCLYPLAAICVVLMYAANVSAIAQTPDPDRWSPFEEGEYDPADFVTSTAEYKHGDAVIRIAHANRVAPPVQDEIPHYCRAWMQVLVDGKVVWSRFHDDIEPLGGSFGLFVVPPPDPDYFAVVKCGDYDDRLYLVKSDGTVLDVIGESGFLTEDKRFLISYAQVCNGLYAVDLDRGTVVYGTDNFMPVARWYTDGTKYFFTDWQKDRLYKDEVRDTIHVLDIESGQLRTETPEEGLFSRSRLIESQLSSFDTSELECCFSPSEGLTQPRLQRLSASPSGHYVQYGDKSLMLIGDSGTQCVMQNANLDHRAWIDDCSARGIRMVHIWSFVPPRQTQDGSVIEDRWGYVYPGLTPWRRGQIKGLRARDQLPKWNLQELDLGIANDSDYYWSRLRDLCYYAHNKRVMVGITVFTGWAKHEADWVYHPLHVDNGGHLTDVRDAVRIESPGVEILDLEWADDWPRARKTQWVWERFSDRLIRELNPLGNVFFVFLDEHSYDEGNMGDHFRDFFKKRGAVWVDWDARREGVDFVYSDTVGGADKNKLAGKGFAAAPARPYLFLEGGPYMGDDVRTAIWTLSMGGGHYTFHADTEQETPRTGIMGYDPNVPGGDKGMYKRDWLGHASRFFNEHVRRLDDMSPHNELVSEGGYCLAAPGIEYAVYVPRSAPADFHIDLKDAAGKTARARFYDPRTGVFGEPFEVTGGESITFSKPGPDDWVLHVVAPNTHS